MAMDLKLLKEIPKMDTLLNGFDDSFNKTIIKYLANGEIDALRHDIKNGLVNKIDTPSIIKRIVEKYKYILTGSLIPVINATGITVHTNLGRSPLNKNVFLDIQNIVCGYSNLEFDLLKGERGERYHHLREYFKILTGAEDVLLVNNNAAAVFIILHTFCSHKDVIISRGELVEIGGSFRIPEVMSRSGSKMVEVGTTNKTKASDYINAINENTSMILKVHKSNYIISGFTEEVNFEDIPTIASMHELLSYFDVGSGLLIKNSELHPAEPSLKDIIKSGFDLVSASGDKLLGGPQAGIILGKKKLIDQIKQNQLLRMLRVDKITLSLMQSTLKHYLFEKYENIATIQLLQEPLDHLKHKADKLKNIIKKELKTSLLKCKIQKDTSFAGGGSCPMEKIATYSITIKLKNLKTSDAETLLRKFNPPIICRIKNDELVMDVRTIFEHQITIIGDAFSWLTKTI